MQQVRLGLPKEVRLLSARFRVKVLPDFVLALPEKVRQKHYAPAKLAGDHQIIAPTPTCSLIDLPAMLKLADWKLVGATRQNEMSGPYQILLFRFSQEQAVGQMHIRVFERLCNESLWQLRAFSNPFTTEGKEDIPDGAITLNLNSRQRLVEVDGRQSGIKPAYVFSIKTSQSVRVLTAA